MCNVNHNLELNKRRTFAIISHPDAGKTTITEKLLLLGKVIRISGTIKSRGSGKFAMSDWMSIEKERGISITTSVMQFTYKGILINLLDTPGHQDFSEDTYRILTAVDFCIVIVDAAKGIEERTKKLIDVTRIHKTPIITFINKLDRDSRDPIEILDQIEKELKLDCTPITWPISCGKNFQGVYHFHDKNFYFYHKINKKKNCTFYPKYVSNISNVLLDTYLGKISACQLREELKLIIGIYPEFCQKKFLKGKLTPIFFGSALSNFGVDHLLFGLLKWSPSPLYRQTNIRKVYPKEKFFTGFVFKIQANMNLKHRDRIAFIRIVSGQYTKGMRLRHVRLKKDIIISNAVSFLAGNRFIIDKAYPGDIIGLYNHGTIKIGDTFTEGEEIKFTGIPSFAPEIFRSIFLKHSLQKKQLTKGLIQLSEEGAIQVFRPIKNNHIILGAIGTLQFDVVISRLKTEYNIDAKYVAVNISCARWIFSKDSNKIKNFVKCYHDYLAFDNTNHLIYLAPSKANLNIVISRHPEILFYKVKEN